jgi:hypothetical protein
MVITFYNNIISLKLNAKVSVKDQAGPGLQDRSGSGDLPARIKRNYSMKIKRKCPSPLSRLIKIFRPDEYQDWVTNVEVKNMLFHYVSFFGMGENSK